jgi:hypothetical protein
MTLKKLVRIAKAYSNLGGAIQEQLDDVLEENVSGCNVNALNIIEMWLVNIDDDDDETLRDGIEAALETIQNEQFEANYPGSEYDRDEEEEEEEPDDSGLRAPYFKP